MATLAILSAGAAQSVVTQTAAAFRAATGIECTSSFGAVGAQKAQLLGGASADVVVLTAAIIDELIASGHVAAGTRRDLGPVGGGVAVRTGTPWPDVSLPERLAANLCAASAIYIPDPATATAGMQFVRMCERLGIVDAVRPRLRTFPNGFAAMTAMARSGAPMEIGVTQVTEIRYVEGVDLVAPLPASLQNLTVYSLGIAAKAANPEAARDFAGRLTDPDAQAMLKAAGFGSV